MKNCALSFLFISILIGSIIPAYAQMPYHDFPPTPAFRTVGTQNGTIYAKNYYYPLNITGIGTVSVKSSNSTHTITISNANGANQGSYNTTQANNVNKNVGGYQINFINGSGSTVNIVNSHSGHQVNVTIASTGSGGTITGSGSSPQMTYWTGTSSIGGATNMLWDNANNVLKGLSDVTTSLGTSSLRFLNIFASVINGTTVRANTLTASTGNTISMTSPTYSIGNNEISTTNFNIYEKFPTDANAITIQPISGNKLSSIAIAPSGTNTQSLLTIYGKSDIQTNSLDLVIGRGFETLSSYHIAEFERGNASLIPIEVYMHTTKLESYDVADTITSYVNQLFKGIITQYNSVNTAGLGVPAIYGYNRLTGLTGASGTVTSYTVGGTDGTFEVSYDLYATRSTTYSFDVDVTWTDEASNSETLHLPNMNPQIAGVLQTVSNPDGPTFQGLPVTIHAKHGTTITIQTNAGGTYTTVTYNIEGFIKELS